MGIEFREGSLSITPTCHAKATKGMIFNVNIGLSGLVNKEASDSKGKDVSLFIGDSVLVRYFFICCKVQETEKERERESQLDA